MKILHLLLISLIFSISIYAHDQISLTKKEIIFLKQHPTIVLGSDKDWKPYVIKGSDGNISGYDADVLGLINQVSGANFVLKLGRWKDMIEKAKDREIDGLSTGSIDEDRKDFLNYSNIYITIKKMIITSKENPKNINSIYDLDGKIIAIHRANAVDLKIARGLKRAKIVQFDTIEEVISSVVTDEADAMFGNGAVFYLANELGLPYLRRASSLKEPLKLAFGIRKDWPEAISIINKSLKLIGEAKLLELKKKWFWDNRVLIVSKKNSKLKLNAKEKGYLQKKAVIQYCIDPDWMPFEQIKDGKHIGMSAEYIGILQSKIGVPFSLVPTNSWSQSLQYIKDKKCDMLSLAMETKNRSGYLNFTTSYFSSPLVLATKNDKSFISDFHELDGKKIGISRDYASAEFLKKRYAKVKFVEMDSTFDGLQQVVQGKIFGFVGSLTAVGYQIQKEFPIELKIAARFNEKLHLSLAVRSDEIELFDILDKTIATINNKQVDEIKNHWISIKYDQGFDKQLFWYVIIPLVSLALFSVFRQFILRRYNKKLEEKVLKKVEELREKDELLFQKYRMAAMGEMLSMIAHQWRQPLGAISSAIMSVDVKLASGKFDLEDRDSRDKFMVYLEKKHNSINDYVHYLSETTDDFRNFFNPNRDKEETALTKPIVNALNILQNFLEKHNIKLIKDFQIDNSYLLYQNEIMQVIISMLKNSEENFSANKTVDPIITLRTYKEDNYYVISICDNGGGVADDIKDKIFEPYFSTKKAKNGTGLGLYMSKIMIEDHHMGSLSIENSDEGACFYIKFEKLS